MRFPACQREREACEREEHAFGEGQTRNGRSRGQGGGGGEARWSRIQKIEEVIASVFWPLLCLFYTKHLVQYPFEQVQKFCKKYIPAWTTTTLLPKTAPPKPTEHSPHDQSRRQPTKGAGMGELYVGRG